MNSHEFHELTHLVMDSPAKAPALLFQGGFDDWHARAHLAHFLAMPEFKKQDEAIELFRTIVDVEADLENPEEVEEKVYALQRLSTLMRERHDYEKALYYINLAVELVESTDFLYKHILRGEIWADRWNTLYHLKKVDIAQGEIDEKIQAFGSLPDLHNSYLYYGYRFKAQVYATEGLKEEALAAMRMALSYMDLAPEYKEKTEQALNAPHNNVPWILNSVDHSCPPPDSIQWDI